MTPVPKGQGPGGALAVTPGPQERGPQERGQGFPGNSWCSGCLGTAWGHGGPPLDSRAGPSPGR